MSRFKAVPWFEVGSIVASFGGVFSVIEGYVNDDRMSIITGLAMFAMSYALDAQAELRKREGRAVLTIHPEGSNEITFDHVRGRSSGWSYYPDSSLPGVWRWSAYGPRGSNRGSAQSSLEARDLATRSAEDLCRG